MNLHPSVVQVVDQLQKAELHAARSGREVVRALRETVIESRSSDIQTFAGEIEAAVQAILHVMPAYAPPLNAICRFITRFDNSILRGDSLEETKSRLIEETESYLQNAELAPHKIAQYTSEIIRPGMSVYTHTLSETVMHGLSAAWKKGITFQVLVSESQPNLDGWDTARKLVELGVEVKLGIDAAIGELVSQADLMLTGTEGITPQGSVICKVGTYLAALAAREAGIPYFVLADTNKFIPLFVIGFFSIADQLVLPDFLEDRQVEGVELNTQLFDETPTKLITGVVTEKGIISSLACSMITFKEPAGDLLTSMLARAGILTAVPT